MIPLIQRSTPALNNLKGKSRQEWYSRNGKRRLNIYMATAALFVCLVVFNSQVYIPTTSQQVKLDAIVTVAMCGFNANEMVQALRTKGEWKGPIYVITDDPSQEDTNLCTPVDVRGNHPTFLNQSEFEDYKRGIQEFNPDIWSKWHKTQIFQLLPDTINTVVFMDADMLAQQPLEKSWLPSLAPMIANPNCELTSYPERWYTKIPLLGKYDRQNAGKIGGGMSIQKRTETAAFLKEWSNRLVRKPFMSRDQGKLTLSIDALDTKICWLPSHWWHLQNQADLIDRLWFSIVVGKGTFLHLASSKKGAWKEMSTKKCDLSNLPDKVPTNKSTP
jgi:hypothetical protein